MKLVVFAHTPPPFHGQSYMVRLMLDGLQERANGAETNLRIFHIDAKLSSKLEAIGRFQWSKLFLVLKYCAEAYFHRLTNKADALYYIPAPGVRAAVYRDWIVMFLCRPIFKKTILHWHAAGLAEWLETTAKSWEREITLRLLSGADLSIVLSNSNRSDAARFLPKMIKVVPNGIPDPCPGFGVTVFPERQKRLTERMHQMKSTFTVVFLGACTEAKGLFATLDAVAILNRRLHATQPHMSAALVVAGDFSSQEDRRRFDRRISEPDLAGIAQYCGFVDAEAKYVLFRKADCLSFPSLYAAEGQPVTIIEALAFGLPVVATRWRGIPEILAGSESRLIEGQDSERLSAALEQLVDTGDWRTNRDLFLSRYSLAKHYDNLRHAFERVS
jgi:glycosyltransferase involved in cell wall biosynthesis